MLPIVPHPTRITVVMFALVLSAMCAACGWTTAGSTGLLSPVDAVHEEIPGYTISEITPADVDPTFRGEEFESLAGIAVSQNGDAVLRVLAGQLKSGDGQAFIRTYLGALSDRTRDGVGVSSETQQLGEHVVTHFNVPLTAEGYTYADGPTVVVAYVAFGSAPATVEDALTKVLDNVR
jgi:hypothetical protein